jgi:hypothetical protein
MKKVRTFATVKQKSPVTMRHTREIFNMSINTKTKQDEQERNHQVRCAAYSCHCECHLDGTGCFLLYEALNEKSDLRVNSFLVKSE